MALSFRGEIWGSNGNSATNRAYIASSNSFSSSDTVDIDQAQPFWNFRHPDGTHSISFVIDVGASNLLQSHLSALSGNGAVNVDSGVIEIIYSTGAILYRIISGSIYVTGSSNNKLRIYLQTTTGRPS